MMWFSWWLRHPQGAFNFALYVMIGCLLMVMICANARLYGLMNLFASGVMLSLGTAFLTLLFHGRPGDDGDDWRRGNDDPEPPVPTPGGGGVLLPAIWRSG